MGERIALTAKMRQLCGQAEFLRAGNSEEQLDSALGDLLVKKVYLEWGLVEVRGLRVNGQVCSPDLLIAAGPEPLVEEVLSSIQAELELTETERKNS